MRRAIRRISLALGVAAALPFAAPAASPGDRTGKDVVDHVCATCHGTGKDGAPKIGDKAAWIDRAKLGFDSAVRSAINGHGAMPARGGMPDLTDAEMRAAVAYMFYQSVSKEGPAQK